MQLIKNVNPQSSREAEQDLSLLPGHRPFCCCASNAADENGHSQGAAN